jgi:regulator of sirC expression with transglutaminase-like and TPR domain
VDPTARFAELVAAGCEPLDEAALAIAAHAHPADHPLDVPAQLDRLDRLTHDFETVGASRDAADLCRFLFVERGFTGNRDAYYEPANSLLDRVLDRRLGIPISLSVLAMEVGRRAGIGLLGVGMPGHFLVRSAGDSDAFFDPFTGGMPLDPAGCEARLRQVGGGAARLGPTDLAPVDSLDIVARMLANLHRIYLEASDRPNLAWVLRLRTMLPGSDPAFRRQLAGVLSALGRFWQAADELELLAEEQPATADRHRRAAERLRANLN